MPPAGAPPHPSLRDARQRTLREVELQRLLTRTPARPPRRIPRQIFPKLLEAAYARELVGMIRRAREAYAEVLRELPALSRAAAQERARLDAGEGRRGRELVEQAHRRALSMIGFNAIENLATTYAQRTAAHNRQQLARQVKAAFGVDIFTRDRRLAAMSDDFVQTNVALIRRLPERLRDDVDAIVQRSVTTGVLVGDLTDEIEERFEVTERHARLIARDQIGKFYGDVNAARQRELGINRFIWRTADDERVRSSHAELEGQEFSYDDLPTNDRGERIKPGDDIQCRCYGEPVFDDVLEGGLPGRDEESEDEGEARTDDDGMAELAEVRAMIARSRYRLDFDPDQPRDESGKWTGGAGGGSAIRTKAGEPPAPTPPKPPKRVRAPSKAAQRRAASEVLRTGTLTKITPVSTKSANGVFFAEVRGENGEVQKAVWKPMAGEQPNLRSNVPVGTYATREYVASEVAKQLGVEDLVAPVAIREGAHAVSREEHSYERPVDWGDLPDALHGTGSIQLFTEADKYDDDVVFEREAAERARVYDFVTGNSDRHGNNILVRKVRGKTMPVLIDHGLSFPNGTPDRFIQPAATTREAGPLLPSTIKQINAINLKKLARTMGDNGIEAPAIKATLQRVRGLQRNPALLEVPADAPTDDRRARARIFEGAARSTLGTAAPGAYYKHLTAEDLDEIHKLVKEYVL